MSSDLPSDISQWLAVNEETLFLHDGILRVTDLIELPQNISTNNESEAIPEVVTFDSKAPTELTQKILAICDLKNNCYSKLLDYRLNAVLGLWRAYHILAVEQNSRISSLSNEETIALLKQMGIVQQAGESESFSSRVGLLLIYPLLQSQSKLDPSLCANTINLLLGCLVECAPLSLLKEPVDCLNGLEDLLCGWLGEVKSRLSRYGDVDDAQIQDAQDREKAACALVALSCARGSMKTFIHTIHLLQKLPDVHGLRLGNVLEKLLQLEGGFGYPSALLGTKHVLCWGFEDMLNSNMSCSDENASDKEFDSGRSITCDDKFIYTTNSFGVGVSKIGNGFNGSLRGFVYCKNVNIGPGWLAMVGRKLLFRCHSYDDQLSHMADVMNPSTLEVKGVVSRPDDKIDENDNKGSVTTIQFCSDGHYLYWVWCLPINDRTIKCGIPIFVNIYKLKDPGNELEVVRIKILLQKKDDNSRKTVNESLLAKLKPYKSSAAAQHASASSSAPASQEATSLSSCGIPLKSLLRVPIYTCGSSITIVTTAIGTGNTSSRSLFGGGSSVPGLRALATNLTFSLTTGHFVARNDLTDAPTCSLARGAPLHSLGICYDYHHNMIWTCSLDYIDQFLNPGPQAIHHIHRRMQIDSNHTALDEKLSPAEVIRVLLQHVGSMCCHHLSCDFLQTPLGSVLLQQQQPLDLSHLTRVLDILEIATRAGDEKIICCALIIIQVIFKTFTFGENCDEKKILLKRLSSVVWSLLESEDSYRFERDLSSSCLFYGVQAEACKVVTAGFDILYLSNREKANLISSLISFAGQEKQPHMHLLDLIMSSLSDFLQNLQDPEEDINYLRVLDNEIIDKLLNVCLEEWRETLEEQVNATNMDIFNSIISTIPIASPCMRYLMSHQHYLLKKAVLHTNKIFNSQNDQMEEYVNSSLFTCIKQYSQLVFQTSFKALEMLREALRAVLGQSENTSSKLQGLERHAKSSTIGYLLPLLVTCLKHENIRSLFLAESSLMELSVKLVISACQVLYLFKSSMDSYFIGNLNFRKKDDDVPEDDEILSKLKIPTPWAAGRIVETIHPIRDNYKFEETVQIPGARCLYLRFDSRCSTQYDYDKLIVYAGCGANSRKVAEFGGNTVGYGSRSVLGSGWPKDLLKVEGDTVKFSFEMRSGREHNTPDKALWGFLITVRAQENTQDVSAGLPFIPDLVLMLSTLCCDLLKMLYEGNVTDANEDTCSTLLQSPLLETCSVPFIEFESVTSSSTVNSSKNAKIDNEEELTVLGGINVSIYNIAKKCLLNDGILKNLRLLSGLSSPQFRPSIRDIIKPNLIEKYIISAFVKHAGLVDIVSKSLEITEDLDSETPSLLRCISIEIYKKFDSSIRRLQILSELEQKWNNEVEDIKKGLMPVNMSFFAMHHLLESQSKELSLLCCLKDVAFDANSLESVVTSLKEKMELEVTSTSDDDLQMPRTRKLISAIFEKAVILLSIEPDPKSLDCLDVLQKSALIQQPSRKYSRSMSAPTCDVGLTKNTADLMSGSMIDSRTIADQNRNDAEDFPNQPASPYIEIIDNIFSFIGELHNENISCDTFFSVISARNKRANTRLKALKCMQELLSSASKVNCSSNLVTAITSILQKGPRIGELTCSGMIEEVNRAFGETMSCAVQVATENPFACYYGIGILCTIPFTRNEEKCLVESGLVQLLDNLCSLNNYEYDACLSSKGVEKQSIQQKVSTLAWAGFQVLANRCVSWEENACEKNRTRENYENSGLALQVATLLSNHLARATEVSSGEATGNDALQEVLSLLNNLSRSMLGKTILSQSSCVSKLLSLLVDHRPSPKLVLIILQLCRFALPLMTPEECEKVTLPEWNSKLLPSPVSTLDVASKIVQLLVSKLGDFLIPGLQTSLSRQPSKCDLTKNSARESSADFIDEYFAADGQNDRIDPSTDVTDQKLSVFLHKRPDQTAHEVIQVLLNGSEEALLRFNGNTNLEKVISLDKEMAKTCKAEICTEPIKVALRKSTKWASLGLVLSTAIPSNLGPSGSDGKIEGKKMAVESLCKERNFELLRTDLLRPFISDNVANSMASEVLNLLHSLMMPSSPSQVKSFELWSSTILDVLKASLIEIPKLLESLDVGKQTQINLLNLLIKSKQILATLCILGGFSETIKPCANVNINGPGIYNSYGEVMSVSESEGIAIVRIKPPKNGENYPQASDVIEVSLSRVSTPGGQPIDIKNEIICQPVVSALRAVLASSNSPSLRKSIDALEGSSLSMTVARVFTEIQTKSFSVLKKYFSCSHFVAAFLKDFPNGVNMLKNIAKDSTAGDRPSQLEKNCHKMKMFYRDCARPVPRSTGSTKKSTDISWHITRVYPPVRASLFTYDECGITFLGDPSAGSGFPRGTFVYTNRRMLATTASFYWEVEVCSFGDTREDNGPVVSFGFAPNAEKKDGAWTNPVGTVLFHNNGRAVHYNGPSLLQWKSIRLNVTINPGDIVGCGWERMADAFLPDSDIKGVVFFTYNGNRLPSVLDDVSAGLWPVIHIQKKNTQIKANFGRTTFKYAKGHEYRFNQAKRSDVCPELEMFSFPGLTEPETEQLFAGQTSEEHKDMSEALPCTIPANQKPRKEYPAENCVLYKYKSAYDKFLSIGPDLHAVKGGLPDESDCDEEVSDEDYHSLLVKAWELKVFPVIRRRFRNEAERKDGLEQIRGALQLGMTDIARQTVEFLYEENDGIPRDLYLPTIDDVKEEAAKFEIAKIFKGTIVMVRPSKSASFLPKYAVHSMLKTFGSVGVVLRVDTPNEIVQVECYLQSEGVLVRYWYPLDALERPPHGSLKPSVIGSQGIDANNPHIHRELIRHERALVGLHCRSALIQLIDFCNDQENGCEVYSAVAQTSSMASCTVLLQELDVENLQLLSDECLTSATPRGDAVESSINSCRNPKQCLSSLSSSPSDLFYANFTRLSNQLDSAIQRAALQGEGCLIELTNQICTTLQLAPEGYLSEDITMAKGTVSTDVFFPGVCFIISSCKSEAKNKKSTASKTVFAKIFSYSGSKVKKDGSMSKQKVVFYPYDASSSGSSNMPNSVSDAYPSLMLPCDRIFVKYGMTPSPGIVLSLNAIPPQLPLALAYVEQLLVFKHKELYDKAHKHDDDGTGNPSAVTVGVLLNVVELLSGYILRTEVPILLKERIFHLFAEVLRTLHMTAAHSSKFQGSQDDQNIFFPPSMHFSSQIGPSLSLLSQLQSELNCLYKEETKQWPPVPTALHEQGVFTSYFQALAEVCLAISEVTSPSSFAPLPALTPIGPSTHSDYGNTFSFGSLVSSLVGDYAQAASSGILAATLNAPPSPSVTKRKKLKAKRDSEKSTKPQSGSSSPRSSDIETHSNNGKSFGACSSPGKMAECTWFHKAFTVSHILRSLVLNDEQGHLVVDRVICETSHELIASTSHARLLVIKGIPKYITQNEAKTAIRKALAGCGGIYRDEIYIPTSVGPKFGDATEKRNITGHGVIEIRLSNKVEAAIKALHKHVSYFSEFHPGGIVNISEDFQVSTIDTNLQTSDSRYQHIIDEYFHQKLVSDDGELADNALIALTEIFHSCFIAEHKLSLSDPKHESGYICLSKEQITNQVQGNLFYTFLNVLKPAKQAFNEMVTQMLTNYGIVKHLEKERQFEQGQSSPIASQDDKKYALSVSGQRPAVKKTKHSKKGGDVSCKENVPCGAGHQEESFDHYLTLDGFMQFVRHKAEDDDTIVWSAILASGYDIHCERCCCMDDSQAIQMAKLWNLDMDAALVSHVNALCEKLALKPASIHPHEIYITKCELANPEYCILQDVPIESARIRFKFLSTLNSNLESYFLPLVNFQPSSIYIHNSAAMLSAIRSLIFYSSKLTLLDKILNVTALRRPNQAAPEVILNPLETVGCETNNVLQTQFCQAIRQLHEVPSSQLCVKPASGGDPMYAFNITFTGEKVLGTSGSFRHFLSQVSKELQGPLIDLFVTCPSSSANRNKDKLLLKSGPMTFCEEQLLIALGQLFGITIRAEIPLPLDILQVFWKTLTGVKININLDLQEADILTFNYLKQYDSVSCAEDLDRLLDDYQHPTFTYTTISGKLIELCPNGGKRYVKWSNWKEYVDRIRKLRLSELENTHRVTAIKAGLASIIHLPFLTLMSPHDMEMRTCGIPNVDIEFLKAHTIYQSGLMESDEHIKFFWNTLESFSADEMRKFIKFACNQDRIPMTCPCLAKSTPALSSTQDGSDGCNAVIAHVPPYPMKICPPDARPGLSANKRFIRVETCLFMIKIPQYTSQEILADKLLFAIHCRHDPLSG